MLLPTDIINRIDEIVERSYLNFSFDIIGDKFFSVEQKRQIEALGLLIGRKPLIELLYILVRMRPTEGYRKDATLNQLLDDVSRSGILPSLNDTHQASIDHAKATIHDTIENTKQEIKTKVSQEIHKINNEYKNDLVISRIDTVPDLAEKTTKYTNKLLAVVGGVILASQSNFVRGFTTSMTDTVNNAVTDEATTQAVMSGKKLKEVEAYKITVKDARLCLEENETVIMYTGEVKKIGELKEGDRLQNVGNRADYRLSKKDINVVVKLEKKQAEVFEYELEDGRKLKCTEDHPILIKVKNRLFYFPIGWLEKSIIPYKIVDYNTISTKERKQIVNNKKWAKECGYEDILYAIKDLLPSLVRNYKTGMGFRGLYKLLKLKSCPETFKASISTYFKLYGFDLKTVKLEVFKNNHFNKKYTDKITMDKTQFLNTKKKYILGKIDKNIALKTIARDLGIGCQFLRAWFLKTYGERKYKLYISNIKRKANKQAQANRTADPDKDKKFRDKLRKNIKYLAKASKPQLKLFNSLKDCYPEAKLNAFLFDRMSVDILINKVIIEYDGSGHYMLGRQSKYTDLKRDKFCRKHGYSVIRVKAPKDAQPNLNDLIYLINTIGLNNFEVINAKK